MKPRRWLFISVPLWGHLDYGGYLDLAVALARRGHRVLWASGSLVQEAVVRRGLPFTPLPSVGWRWLPPLPSEVPPAERARRRRERALEAWLHPEEHARALRALSSLIEAWRPDWIVAEPFAGVAAWAAERYDLPLIVVGFPAGRWPAPATPEARVEGEAARSRLAEIAARLQLTGRFWRADPFPQITSPYAHIAFFPARWFIDLEHPDPQNQFFGGRRRASAFSPPPRSRPQVMITLGSTFTGDPAFFIGAARAVQSLGGEPLLVLGRSPFAPGLRETVARALPDLPLRDWVDYPTLFPQLDLVIHHGGMGTTHTALVYGVPQLVVPHAGEQHLQARRVEAAGVGLTLWPSEATSHRWQERIAALLRESVFRERAQDWAQHMEAAGDAEEAAAWLTEWADSAA
ncbi:L-demethylnoviosyl transferase [Candidatus Thermoflexus japonica]|uniref:L-demethylnoviosyl transferase n=2 Tax=root TaxID=1 RepID=A0A2H5Y750_9CHLR|nr:glycosyl transferase family protein [uncultured prokaryote]GBD09275.1 L-demethylnoviosyl transferase [Candidatus Thermoflexus japonica]